MSITRTIHLPIEINEDIQKIAEEQNRPISNVIVLLVRLGLMQYKEKTHAPDEFNFHNGLDGFWGDTDTQED